MKDPVARMPKVFGQFSHAGVLVIQDKCGNLILNPSYVERVLKRPQKPASHRIRMYQEYLDAVMKTMTPAMKGKSEPEVEILLEQN